ALEKWVKPKLEIRLPIRVHRQPPLKLVPHESRIRRKGNPKNHFSAKVVLGRIPINHAFEAPKWRRDRAEAAAGKAGCLSKDAFVRDRSHFGVAPRFDPTGPLRRRLGSKYRHIPSPRLLALGRLASNLEGVVYGYTA
ncbi:hypothetical protein, partial [Novosphingobium sp.]|uniref:hypothetical protein n=1 Tax=Novosphingobium sp. TaxID=1874826 RepID=UPI001AC5A999